MHIATTRPETMLGDTAIAVSPKDPTLHTSDRQNSYYSR